MPSAGGATPGSPGSGLTLRATASSVPDASGSTPAPPHPSPSALALALVAVGVLLLTVRLVYDLDFGFHLAIGHHVLAHGLPHHEFLAPLLADTPLASTFVLGSVAMALAWMVGGPAGLVVLKAACYTGAFVIAADAARRRAPAWPLVTAVLAMGGAVAVAPRLVERPGMFSALGLALIVWLAATVIDRLRAPSWWMLATGAVVSTVWSWTHPEWLIGVAAFALLVGTRIPARVAAWWMVAVAAVPLATYAAWHPMGLGAWWRVIELPLGRAGAVEVSEYNAANWTIMPAAPVIVAGALVLAAVRARQRDWGEAALLALLSATCATSPRGVLPLAIVAIPPAAEALASLLDRVREPRRALAHRLAMVLTIALLMAAALAMPWRPWGLGLHPQLDARGVGAFLAAAGDGDGVIMAEYGDSSLLLSQPGAARSGIVMDGRLESYPQSYIRDVYLPGVTGDDDAVAAHLASLPVGFYYEMYPRRGAASRVPGLRAAGWQLVAWDNAGRLLARPGLAEERGWRVLDVDPADEALIARDEEGLLAALAELSIVCEELEGEAIASGRGRLAQAGVAVRLGRLDVAAFALEIARGEGLDTTARFWATTAEYATVDKDRAGFETALGRLKNMGRDDLAGALEQQWRARFGPSASSKILTTDMD